MEHNIVWYVDRTDLCFGDAVKSQVQPVSTQFFSDYGTQVDGTCFAPISAAVEGGYKGAILNAMLFQLAIQKNAPAYLLVDGMFVDRRKQNQKPLNIVVDNGMPRLADNGTSGLSGLKNDFGNGPDSEDPGIMAVGSKGMLVLETAWQSALNARSQAFFIPPMPNSY